MSKEAYVPPSSSSAAAGAIPGTSTQPFIPRAPTQITYLCAGPSLSHPSNLPIDCGASNAIGQKEQLRCRECGHRVMYKKRTKRMGFIHIQRMNANT